MMSVLSEMHKLTELQVHRLFLNLWKPPFSEITNISDEISTSYHVLYLKYQFSAPKIETVLKLAITTQAWQYLKIHVVSNVFVEFTYII